MNELK